MKPSYTQTFDSIAAFEDRRSLFSTRKSALRLWQTRTHCCGHFVADTDVSSFARARNICCGHKFCVRDTKSVSHFDQKHFVSATNVSQFAQPRNNMGNNVSATMCPRLPRPLHSAGSLFGKENFSYTE